LTVPSPQFLAFAAVAALLFNTVDRDWWRQSVLLAANAVFLASFSNDPVAFLPFAGFLALGYAAQRITRDGARPLLFAGLLVATIAAFFWLKRYTFLPNAVFLPFPYILIGLSYVFFRVVHLIIDSHQGAVDKPVGLLSYLNYTLNFTSLTSGPIQRYQDYRAAELAPLALDIPVAGRALERIVIGYFKVAIVSMLLSQAQQQAFAALGAPHPLSERIFLTGQVVVLYPLYLYCNFSGYVDVVIGTARFFRIALPENFDRPFSAGNFLDFWSHWHMTLSNWLKTYVYNPLLSLMMKRASTPALDPYLAVVAFFVTFFLVGIWHGRTSIFLVFGFLQGLGVSGNKLYQILMARWLGKKPYKALSANPLYHALARGLTFTWFAFSLIFFWSNWDQVHALGDAVGWTGAALLSGLVFAVASLALALWEAGRKMVLSVRHAGEPVVASRYLRTAFTTAMIVITFAAAALNAVPAPEIVYKAF
jgi:alginate O-acetyltransferase complex protein AlgI